MEINWEQKELCKWTYFLKYKLKSTKISKLGLLVFSNEQQVSNAFEDKNHRSKFELSVLTQSRLSLHFRVQNVDEVLELLSEYCLDKNIDYNSNQFKVDTIDDDCVGISFAMVEYFRVKSILKYMCKYDNINNSIIDEISDIMVKCCKGL